MNRIKILTFLTTFQSKRENNAYNAHFSYTIPLVVITKKNENTENKRNN